MPKEVQKTFDMLEQEKRKLLFVQSGKAQLFKNRYKNCDDNDLQYTGRNKGRNSCKGE